MDFLMAVNIDNDQNLILFTPGNPNINRIVQSPNRNK